jgi:predicted flap endonuclease-1-like 5' DNA nuclease
VRIAEVIAVSTADAESLRAAEIESDADLLDRACQRADRRRLAAQTGIGERTLLAWVEYVNLVNLSGVGPTFARLLEAAGVDSCAELARRDPTHLSETMSDLIAARATIRHRPDKGEVAGWIEEARHAQARVER